MPSSVNAKTWGCYDEGSGGRSAHRSEKAKRPTSRLATAYFFPLRDFYSYAPATVFPGYE